MSRATSIGVRNWPRSARAPSSSAASPASRRPAASESRSTALSYRVSSGVRWPWASPALPGPRERCRLNEDSTRPGRLPWPGAPGDRAPRIRSGNARLPVTGGTGLLTSRGIDLRGYCLLLRSSWTRGGTSPQPGNTGPARTRVRGARRLSSHSGSWLAGVRQAAAPVSVPHMALSFSIMLERLEGSAAVMASWRERIKRRYTP